MAKIGLVLDCADPDALGSFWAAALGYDNVGRFGAYVVLRSMARRWRAGEHDLPSPYGPDSPQLAEEAR